VKEKVLILCITAKQKAAYISLSLVQTKSLMIMFKNENVSSYSFSAEANNVKTGVF